MLQYQKFWVNVKKMRRKQENRIKKFSKNSIFTLISWEIEKNGEEFM